MRHSILDVDQWCDIVWSGQIYGSVHDNDWHYVLKIHAHDYYSGAGNRIFQWRPAAEVDRGSCSTYTASLGYGGATVSSSEDVCPHKLEPETSSKFDAFGTEWFGCAQGDGVEGAPSVDTDQNGPGAYYPATVNVYIA